MNRPVIHGDATTMWLPEVPPALTDAQIGGARRVLAAGARDADELRGWLDMLGLGVAG